MADEAPILIAGGGIGGLALALALARKGRASTVLERQQAPGAEGAGIQLGPNAVRALRDLELGEALEPWVGEPEAIEVLAGASGRRLARLPLGGWIAARHGAPYWTAHRGDLHRVLADAAAADPLIEIRTGFEVASVTQTAAQVTVTDNAGRSAAGPILVGADGLWSAVRQAVAPESTPQPVGATATRTVIAAAEAARLYTPSIGLWLGPDAHVVHYPVRGGSDDCRHGHRARGLAGPGVGCPAGHDRPAAAARAVPRQPHRSSPAPLRRPAGVAQVGAQHAAAAADMGPGPRRADRRCGASHAALPGAGRGAGPGGRDRARRLRA